MARNRNILPLLALLLGAACVEAGPPKLVVVVVVDQMRADFLTRFDEQFTGGFRRMLDHGVMFEDAHQDHARTETAVGHAAIATGVFPRTHGIVGNEFFNRRVWRTMYSAEDTNSALVGVPDGVELDRRPGRSPVNMLVPALGDWIKASSPDSKVFAVALKDRSAIFMGGHDSDGSFWYEASSGQWISSEYYGNNLPAWLVAFNAEDPFGRYKDTSWTKSAEESAYQLSHADDYPGELVRGSAMPHQYPDGPRFYTNLEISPFADEVTFEFVRKLIDEESLGRGDAPDLLMLGISTPDHVGHRFGPNSHEIQDLYLRLDHSLGELFQFLDDKIGSDHYVVTLSSDHAVLPLPEYLREQGIDSRRVSGRTFGVAIGEAIALAKTDLPYPINVQYGGGLILEYDSNVVTGSQASEFRDALASRIRDIDFIADAYTLADVASESVDRPYLDMYRHQYYPDRTPDISLRFKEHTLLSMARGTSHGSPYRYDTHVPIVFWGRGVNSGRVERRVSTVDIAPTLSLLFGIDPPASLDGESLPEVASR